MKIKSIIACGMLLLGVGAATTSCEDMMTADNNLVTTDLAPQDTVYQMMGIVKRMQQLADRTILLGEVRADLLEVDAARASSDIQELYNNNISTTNKYNSPAEYYAVINSCNIYLAHVDSLYSVYGQRYYDKEVIAAKCFRAWCYLELAKIYGAVPFITEPVVSAQTAEQIVASGEKRDMLSILDFCIQDLAPYAYRDENSNLRPGYGYSYSGVTARELFLPVRALLGELYLWRGSYKGRGAGQSDFIDAVRMYHDYLCFPGEEKSVGNYTLEFTNTNWTAQNPIRNTSLYAIYNFGLGNTSAYAAVLPLDTAAYYGTTSDLRAIFNSNYSNNYYPSVKPAKRMLDISKRQDYVFVSYNLASSDTIRTYAPKDKANIGDELLAGDLRLADNYRTVSNISESRYNSNVNSTKQFITKWLGGNTNINDERRQTYIIYYRTNTLYLHMAEALNMAGFPETAYAVLAYGLTYETLNASYRMVKPQIPDGAGGLKDTMFYMPVISEDEFDGLCDIKAYANITTTDYDSDPALKSKADKSFVVWKSTVFKNIPKYGNNRTANNTGPWLTYQQLTGSMINYKNQLGIHSLGSGDTEFNEHYALDDKATIDNLRQGGIRPAVPAGWTEGGSPLSQTDWEAVTPGLPTSATARATLYAQYVLDFNLYPTRLANYNADRAYLQSTAVKTKRQDQVSWYILEEEALENSFEGQRFYDILRYQMQYGKVGGTSATIQMPDSIVKHYGATPNMDGKPWYLPLPAR